MQSNNECEGGRRSIVDSLLLGTRRKWNAATAARVECVCVCVSEMVCERNQLQRALQYN